MIRRGCAENITTVAKKFVYFYPLNTLNEIRNLVFYPFKNTDLFSKAIDLVLGCLLFISCAEKKPMEKTCFLARIDHASFFLA